MTTNSSNEPTNWATVPHSHLYSTSSLINNAVHAGDGQPDVQTAPYYPSCDLTSSNNWNNPDGPAQHPIDHSQNHNEQDFDNYNGQFQGFAQPVPHEQWASEHQHSVVAADVDPSLQSGYFSSSAPSTASTFSYSTASDMSANGYAYQSAECRPTWDTMATVPPPPQLPAASRYYTQSPAVSDFSSSTANNASADAHTHYCQPVDSQLAWGPAATVPPPPQQLAAASHDPAQSPAAAYDFPSSANTTSDAHLYPPVHSQPTWGTAVTTPAPPPHYPAQSPVASEFSSSHTLLSTDNMIQPDRWYITNSQASWDTSTTIAPTQQMQSPHRPAQYRLPQPGSQPHPSTIPPLPTQSVSGQWQEPSPLGTTPSPAIAQQTPSPTQTIGTGKGKGKEVPDLTDLARFVPPPPPTMEILWDNSTPDTMKTFLEKKAEIEANRLSESRSRSVSVSTPESSMSAQPARGHGKGKGKGKGKGNQAVLNSMPPPPVPPVVGTSRQTRAGSSSASSSVSRTRRSQKRSRSDEDGEEDGHQPSGSGSNKRACEDFASPCLPQQAAKIGQVADPVPENMRSAVVKAVEDGLEWQKRRLSNWVAFFRDRVQICQCDAAKVTTIRMFSGINHPCLNCLKRLLNDARALTWLGCTTIPSHAGKYPKRWARLESFDSALYHEHFPIVEWLGHIALHSRVNKRTGEISYFFEAPIYLWWSARSKIDGRGDLPPPKEEYGEREEVYGFEEPIWVWSTPTEDADLASQSFPNRAPSVGELEYLDVDEVNIPKDSQAEGGETASDTPPVGDATASPVQLEETSQVPDPFDVTLKGLDSDTASAPDFSYLYDLLTTPDPFSAFEADTNTNTDGNASDTTTQPETRDTISNKDGFSALPDSQVQLFGRDSGLKGLKENSTDTGSVEESTAGGVAASGDQSSKSEGGARTVNPEGSTHGDDGGNGTPAPASGDQSNDTTDAAADAHPNPSEPGPDEDDLDIGEWIDLTALD
ncbi:hypothetical protein AAF712_001202 [Marasmius tenuissimus]|uniref:Uncharacterized protein n=1 Tax=Marasmius tenuissimus TaxID=585030 RepID=A0ABR3ACT4_9AGAR